MYLTYILKYLIYSMQYVLIGPDHVQLSKGVLTNLSPMLYIFFDLCIAYLLSAVLSITCWLNFLLLDLFLFLFPLWINRV